MQPSLADIFEAVPHGLLWVVRDGTVRYANSAAATLTGLGAGRPVWDPDLLRAIAAALKTGTAQALEATGVARSGAAVPVLQCRVIPGLGRDDVFVLAQGDTGAEGSVADQLMTLIEHDLRVPLHELQAQLAHEARTARDPGMAGVLQRLQPLTAALDTLVDLARVWRGGALMVDERLELWPLIQQVWQDVEPLADQRRVTARFRSSQPPDHLAPLYGNGTWLRRVLRECLEAAVRSGRPGSTLHIEHRQNGPHALVIFRDCGVFAPQQGDSVALPHRPTTRGTPARLPAREQLSLDLCRHVLALHGGQLRDENEDGQRNFLIELPTGAPFRTAPQTIDAAQVQQYARDLSALMARRRRSEPAQPDTALPPSPTRAGQPG
jgi:hypothetical protein